MSPPTSSIGSREQNELSSLTQATGQRDNPQGSRTQKNLHTSASTKLRRSQRDRQNARPEQKRLQPPAIQMPLLQPPLQLRVHLSIPKSCMVVKDSQQGPRKRLLKVRRLSQTHRCDRPNRTSFAALFLHGGIANDQTREQLFRCGLRLRLFRGEILKDSQALVDTIWSRVKLSGLMLTKSQKSPPLTDSFAKGSSRLTA